VFRYGGATGGHRTSVVVFIGEDDRRKKREVRASLTRIVRERVGSEK
jgi:hypothetical protein